MLNNMKSRREEEERIKNEGRLPPGQALTQKFPVLHYGPVPKFDAATWERYAESVAGILAVDGRE